MNTDTNTSVPAITATRVPEGAQKLEVLPRHFAGSMLKVEDAVYHFMRFLDGAYRDGHWHFYELSNGGFYMAPDREQPVHVYVKTNGYGGEMSADAVGITACLFAFSHLALETKNDVLILQYFLLRDFALSHPERTEIFAAIN